MSRIQATHSRPRAVVYARISDDRSGEGQGVARQIEACTERAEREGWDLVGEPLRDDSISAWRSGVVRPGYRELLRMVRDREVEVVMVWHMSRLWRGRVERASGIDVFKDAGVRLAVVKGQEIDFSTAYGRGMAGLLGEFDTMESDVKSERIVAQKNQALKDGRWRGGRRPFGFNKDAVTHRVAEADAIRRATEQVLTGRSLNAVAKEWDAAGLKTTTGGTWNHAKVKRVLLRPRNSGYMNTGSADAYDIEVLGKAKWEPIVDREKFDDLYRMLTGDGHRRPPGWTDAKWFGSGIYRCGREGCEEPMRSATVQPRGRKALNIYRCSSGGHLSIMSAKTDDYVRQVVAARVRDPLVVALMTAGESDTMRLDRDRRAALVRKIEQTEADYDDDLIDARRYKAKVAKVSAELEAIEHRLAVGVQQASVDPIFSDRDPGAAFKNAPLDVQRRVCRSVMTVTVLPATHRGAAWTAERLRIGQVGEAVAS